MSVAWILLIVVNATGWLLPTPTDKDGWELRVRGLSVSGPYLAGERIGAIRFEIVLLNHSKETREHDPLVITRGIGALQLAIIQPDGKEAPNSAAPFLPRDPFTQRSKLPAGQHASLDLRFSEFGYQGVRQPGLHRLEVSLKIDTITVKAPGVAFEVLDEKAETVLSEHKIPVEGYQLNRPPEQQSRPFVRQVKTGNRILLIYRRYNGPKWGGGIDGTFRLAELTEKVEMKVEGAFGDGKPLRITYKDANSKTGTTTLIVNSADGLPWTEEEERLLQERLKRDAAKSPLDVPAPKPVKP